MRINLDSIDPFQPELHLSLEQSHVLIGRNGDAHIQVNDRWVSRLHCEIRQENGGLVVRDLRSKHGTLVNGEEIHYTTLQSGDLLTIGIRVFRVTFRTPAKCRTNPKIKEVSYARLKSQAG